jgi:catechol 2,3-dioxygenase-like lactoylglutathione lyase family enzyme
MRPRADTLDRIDDPEREARAQLHAVRSLRRGNNRIRGLHHHAVRTGDMAATRAFYEDVLGLPLIATTTEELALAPDEKTPFLQCCFELGDGSALAFVEFLPEAVGPADKLPRDGIDHHVALSVSNFADIARLKTKFDALGYANCGIDHGTYYSLYVRDPNGMLVELVVDAPNELALGEAVAEQAHARLADWLRGNHAVPRGPRLAARFALSSSTPAEIRRVVCGRL